MTDVLPEFPLPTTVPALGYVEVTDEVATGFVVLHEIVTPQLLFPEVMVQEGVTIVPDIVWVELTVGLLVLSLSAQIFVS